MSLRKPIEAVLVACVVLVAGLFLALVLVIASPLFALWAFFYALSTQRRSVFSPTQTTVSNPKHKEVTPEILNSRN